MHDRERYFHLLAIWSSTWLTVVKLRDKLASYSENGVRVEVGVTSLEYVSGERFIAWRLDHEVHMRRAHRATVRGGKQCSHRSIPWDRIGRRLDGPDEILSILVGVEVTATVDLRGLLVLHIVEPMLIGLLDLDERVSDRLACER